MKALVIIVIALPLIACIAGFWWVKGQPFDWDSFSRWQGRGAGMSGMHNPGQPLKRE